MEPNFAAHSPSKSNSKASILLLVSVTTTLFTACVASFLYWHNQQLLGLLDSTALSNNLVTNRVDQTRTALPDTSANNQPEDQRRLLMMLENGVDQGGAEILSLPAQETERKVTLGELAFTLPAGWTEKSGRLTNTPQEGDYEFELYGESFDSYVAFLTKDGAQLEISYGYPSTGRANCYLPDREFYEFQNPLLKSEDRDLVIRYQPKPGKAFSESVITHFTDEEATYFECSAFAEDIAQLHVNYTLPETWSEEVLSEMDAIVESFRKAR